MSRGNSICLAFAEAADPAEPLVLLAFASLDEFRNFEARGDAFRDLVLAVPGVLGKG